MKKWLKYTAFIALFGSLGSFLLTSCEKDTGISGDPVIHYVRPTDAAVADSLLASGFLGNLVAIIGDNLQDVREVWFNDLKAILNPNYVTKTSIIVSIPNSTPREVTNLLRVVTGDGRDAVYDFSVDIPEPQIESMLNEYAKAGETTTITGNFFYEPLQVHFPGGVEGTVVAVTERSIEVTVPDGAEEGPIGVTTNFGEAESSFHFRDSRNIFFGMDPQTGWWSEGFMGEAGSEIAINGNYLYYRGNVGDWGWSDMAGGPVDAFGNRHLIPDEAIADPAAYNFKFEVNTLNPFDANAIKILIGNFEDFDNAYVWTGPLDTQGAWRTIVIPFETVQATTDVGVRSEGYAFRFWWHGPGALEADIAFDNFRLVPK